MATSNRVVWWEIETDDPAATQRFYGELFGWTFRRDFTQSESQLGRERWIIEADGRALGGLQPALPGAPRPQAGVRLYAEVADLEATLARAVALGARIERERAFLGSDDFWFANICDPQDTSFGLWTTNPPNLTADEPHDTEQRRGDPGRLAQPLRRQQHGRSSQRPRPGLTSRRPGSSVAAC